MNYGWGDRHTHTHTDRQTDTHINTMTRPGLGAGPSEKVNFAQGDELPRGVSVINGATCLVLKTIYAVLSQRGRL